MPPGNVIEKLEVTNICIATWMDLTYIKLCKKSKKLNGVHDTIAYI